jgi:hypothetical protein
MLMELMGGLVFTGEHQTARQHTGRLGWAGRG